MSTFAGMQVGVTSQTLRTTLTLNELLAELVARKPAAATHSPGWTDVDDNLHGPTPAGTPSSGDPSILPADPVLGFPERIAARYVWWQQPVMPDGSQPPAGTPWTLYGVDVLISREASSFHLLWSTQLSQLVKLPNLAGTGASGTAVEALLKAAHNADAAAQVVAVSPLAITKRDVYLWMADSKENDRDISPKVRIHDIAGMGTDEPSGIRGNRRANLRGDIDLERTSFVSAIAAEAYLGPARITFRELDSKGQGHFSSAILSIDGAFKLYLKECRYPTAPIDLAKRLHAVQLLAYRLIPLAQSAYQHDQDWTNNRRNLLLVDKQLQLVQKFLRAAKANPRYADWVTANGDPLDGI